MNKSEAINRVNELASKGIPFLFISDFKCIDISVLPIDEIDSSEIIFDIQGNRNYDKSEPCSINLSLKRKPVSYEKYLKSYRVVHSEIKAGNTYLLNLTFATPISTSADLKTIFHQSKAKYKLWYKGRIVVFSPEIFIKIEDGKISSFPMKGTIDARIKNATEVILSSKKEMAEHVTIVDLIRNDMSRLAIDVTVENFRYIDELKTNEKHLLQVSSKISGILSEGYLRNMGDIIFSLLPAGSICGAPKNKTLEIIGKVEDFDRGFYTGVIGHFDGKNFDSGVMIRYIEKVSDQLVYKSGGGIHFLSDPKAEYQEMIDKVYVPVY